MSLSPKLTILTIPSEFESAKKLGYPTYGGYLLHRPDDNEIILRWGNSSGEEFNKVINKASAIRANCDKLQSSQRMSKVVNTPDVYEDKIPEGVKAVVRPIEHSDGDDFTVVDGPYSLSEDCYGARWINTDTEYRVWFAWDKTLTAIRVPLGHINDESYPCRSNWGYKFCGAQDKLYSQTLKAAKKIGLTTGAADVLHKDRKYYFLELNSAPTIDSVKIKRFYQQAIEEYLKTQ